MTVQSIVWVLEQSAAEARTRCVAFALANRFDADQPLSCWPGMERIAAEGKMSVRTAQRCVDELVFGLDELIVIFNAGGPPNVRDDRRPNVYIFPALLGRERLREVLLEYPRELILIGGKWSDCAPSAPGTGCQPDTPRGGVSENGARGDKTSTRGVSENGARGDTVDTQSHIDPTVDPTGTLALGFARPPKRPRGRDELWDSMLTACGLAGASPTSTERGAWNRAAKELRAVNATPTEIARRARAFRDRWPGATLTPSALVRRWNEVIATNHQTSAPVVAASDAEPAYWLEDIETRARHAVDTLTAEVREAHGDHLLLEGAHACLDQNVMVPADDLAIAAQAYAEAHGTAGRAAS